MRASLEPATRAVEPGERIEGRLGDLPLVTYCERDAAPYITAGVFLANEPETGVPNLSFHRAMHVSEPSAVAGRSMDRRPPRCRR